MDNQPSSSSSTSRYGSQPNSPFDVDPLPQAANLSQEQLQTLSPTSWLWDPWSLKQEEEAEAKCGSLANPTWRNLRLADHYDEATKSTATPRLDYAPVLPARHFNPVTTFFSLRNYSSPGAFKPIVTMDAEQIGPDDPPHHPLDVTRNVMTTRKPWGIATNLRTEQVYVADREYDVVLVFGPDGAYQGKFGGRGAEPGRFKRPTGLAYDAVNNRIFIADKDYHRIQVFSATTHDFLFTFGKCGRKPNQFRFPWGVAVSKDGYRVAVTDSRNGRVQLFTSDGAYLRQHRFEDGPEMPGRRPVKAYPSGLAFDKSGRFLYVSDFSLHQIYRIDTFNWKIDTIVEKLWRPSGIDVDAAGNLLICDTRNHRIKIFRSDGLPLGCLDRVGDVKFDLPLDISVLSSGHIAVLELNGRVRLF